MTIEDVRRELSNFVEQEFKGGIAEEAINSASQAIGLPFPPEYRAFLCELGAGYVSSEEFVGLGGPKHLDVTWLTNKLRSRNSRLIPQRLLFTARTTFAKRNRRANGG
jgi:SMI1-KNR4 cell-wall